jgi:F0F1-type ATP synthase assembly protein I
MRQTNHSGAGFMQDEKGLDTVVIRRVGDKQIRDWAAIQGYMRRPKEETWNIIEAQLKEQAERLQMPPIEPLQPSRSDEMDKERLEEIKKEIEPRYLAAKDQAQQLENVGVTRQSSRLMLRVGWVSVGALGWVFSWLLDRILSSGTQPEKINDILTLFVKGFSNLTQRFEAILPSGIVEGILLSFGLILLIVAVYAYVKAQRLSGQLLSIERMLHTIVGADPGLDSSQPGKEKPKEQKEEEEKKLSL